MGRIDPGLGPAGTGRPGGLPRRAGGGCPRCGGRVVVDPPTWPDPTPDVYCLSCGFRAPGGAGASVGVGRQRRPSAGGAAPRRRAVRSRARRRAEHLGEQNRAARALWNARPHSAQAPE